MKTTWWGDLWEAARWLWPWIVIFTAALASVLMDFESWRGWYP